MQRPRLLLIDDNVAVVDALETAVRKAMGSMEFELEKWIPSREDGSVRAKLTELFDTRPTLVVTDHDLEENGNYGLMSGTVISRCQVEAIPVGVYSRELNAELAEPELFDFRFPHEAEEAGSAIATILTGFHHLASLLKQRNHRVSSESWSQTIAQILDRPHAASSFSLYSVRSGAAQHGLIEHLQTQFGEADALEMLETYVIGHLLANGILRYPGPLMSDLDLCSYLAVADDRADAVRGLFAACQYDGPFSFGRHFYWHAAVEEQLDGMLGDNDGDLDDPECRRQLVSGAIGDPGRHVCQRCEGVRGGYRCPYTNRTVCDRADCSVPTSSWIPPGAYLSRAEKDYFDAWSPLLGI